jgi:hypothetical protein
VETLFSQEEAKLEIGKTRFPNFTGKWPLANLSRIGGVLYNESMFEAQNQIPKSLEDAEIKTFCPTRIGLGHHIFDGLLDTIDGDYGGFYVLTDEALVDDEGERSRDLLVSAEVAEVVFQQMHQEFTVPCVVQGCWIDQDGLVAYLKVKFPLPDQPARQKLNHWMSMLW